MSKLTSTQKYTVSRLADVVVKAAALCENTRGTVTHEMARLLSYEHGVEFIVNEETIYFAGSERDKQHEQFIQQFSQSVESRGYTCFRQTATSSLILLEDTIVGIVDDYLHSERRSMGFHSTISDPNLTKIVEEFVEEYRKTAKVRQITRLVLSDYGNGISSDPTTTHVHYDHETSDSFYPYFKKTPAQIWNEFKASSSNVMVLIGAPGTGKTNFIRKMLDAQGWYEVNIADDHNVLTNRFIGTTIREINDGGVFVAEDADNLVKKREDGNDILSSILNTTEGIIKTDVKVIISTNLSSVRDIDPALIRPGRAYGVFQFRELTLDEARKIRSDLGLPLDTMDTSKTEWTLSEAINDVHDGTTPTKVAVGFI